MFGSGDHHAGKQTAADPPRVRDIAATHTVEGQQGRVAWGRSSSAAADTKEPFAWAISSDNRSIVGADLDGYFRITLLAPDRMEKCYVHNGTSPSRSVVATCYVMERRSGRLLQFWQFQRLRLVKECRLIIFPPRSHNRVVSATRRWPRDPTRSFLNSSLRQQWFQHCAYVIFASACDQESQSNPAQPSVTEYLDVSP